MAAEGCFTKKMNMLHLMTDLCPEKIYVELTTRCNLQCRMCVKYAEGSCIAEGDMPLEMFRKILPSLGEVGTLILNGIGEPLLHPDLEEIIALARLQMPAHGTIGFQSNGFLLDEHRALHLMQAGLGTICLSLDTMKSPRSVLHFPEEHAFAAVSRAVHHLRAAKSQTPSNCRIGLEMVLTHETAAELPDLLQWAADNEVDYVIATHLFLYGGTAQTASLFNPNSSDAVALFNTYSKKAALRGLRLDGYLSSFLKFTKTAVDQQVLEIVDEMQKEARENGIHLHIQSLLNHTTGKHETVEQYFDKARRIAECQGIELFLPPLQALTERSCPFVTEKAAFIAGNGDVMPCHFLWHTYSCRVLDETLQVQERSFGNIGEQTLEEIWQSDTYRQFRMEAGGYDYASCWSCSLGPCATLINDKFYANDCYGSIVPCGHCQWSLGGVRCL
jgi:putative metalloenzyme radical SAM/SPASM domain maturase